MEYAPTSFRGAPAPTHTCARPLVYSQQVKITTSNTQQMHERKQPINRRRFTWRASNQSGSPSTGRVSSSCGAREGEVIHIHLIHPSNQPTKHPFTHSSVHLPTYPSNHPTAYPDRHTRRTSPICIARSLSLSVLNGSITMQRVSTTCCRQRLAYITKSCSTPPKEPETHN